MSSDEPIAVNCVGCRQTYHVVPSPQDRVAKCRGCGREFVIPAAVGARPKKSSSTRYQSASDYQFGQSIALRLGSSRDVGSESTRYRLDFMGRWRIGVAVATLIVVGIVGAAVYWSLPVEADVSQPAEYLRRGRVAKLVAPSTAYAFRTISDLIEEVELAVVQVEAPGSIGSGFVLDASGLVVTCQHCVDLASDAKIVFADKREFAVLGIRAVRHGSDLVILQVDTQEPLPALPLTAAPPRKGEPVVAFGSPAGLSFTVSEGAISATRTVGELSRIASQLRGGNAISLSRDCQVVQFTATAMPGHSGGPVVDFRGNVVGVTAFGLPYEGRSFEFAISSTEIRDLASQLNETPTPLSVVREQELARLESALETDWEYDANDDDSP